MENLKPELEIDRIRCCICFKRKTKEDKTFQCSKCCNRRIIFIKAIKKPLHSLNRFFTE